MAIKSLLPTPIVSLILMVGAFFLGRFTASWPKTESPRSDANGVQSANATTKMVIPSDQRVIGFLDMEHGKSAISARPDSDVQLSGWAACVDTDSRLAKVEILVDDKVEADAATNYPRPDVAAAYGRPDFEKSGWKASFTTRGIKLGDHSLKASVSCSKGELGLLPAFSLGISPE